MALSQHSIFSTANKPSTETSLTVTAEMWLNAKKVFSEQQTSGHITIDRVRFINLHKGSKQTLYACIAHAGGGSYGDLYHALTEEGTAVVIKFTDIDDISFPNADQQTQQDYDKLVSFIQTNLAENLNSSAEEIILAQKNLLLNSGLLLLDDNYALAIVMADLGISLTHKLMDVAVGLTDISVVERLKFALLCIDEINALHQSDIAGHQNFIHGDISLGNFIINNQGGIHLIDFGSATLITGNVQDNYPLPPSVDERFTNVPPEFKTHRLCSVKSDVYRLGEVLEKLLQPIVGELKEMLSAMHDKIPAHRPSLHAVREKILALQNTYSLTPQNSMSRLGGAPFAKPNKRG